MTVFSFIILPANSSLIEKDRYNKHSFIKKEGNYYIFARQQTGGFGEGKTLDKDTFNFIRLLSSEMESSIYFSIKDLKDKEGESDFSLIEYVEFAGNMDSKKTTILREDTQISYNTMYKIPFVQN